MSEEVAINFNKFGTVQALYDEEAPIDFLGPQTVTRLSTVEWSDFDQKWRVAIPGDPILEYVFVSRKKAIEFERAWYFNSVTAGYMYMSYAIGDDLYEQYKDC